MNRSTGIFIIIAIALIAGGLSYWSGFLSTETGSGTGTETGSEILEIVNVTSRRIGVLYLDLTIRNVGTKDARLEYIVANGTVVDEEDHIIPYGAQIEIEIEVSPYFEPNSLLIMRTHTASGKDFEQTIIIPEPPGPPRVEIHTLYAEDVDDGHEVTIGMRNTGASHTFIDGISGTNYPRILTELPVRLDPGTTVMIKIFYSSENAPDGTAAEIRIHTTEGNTYIKMVAF